MPERTCIQCGTPFHVKFPSNPQKLCSPKCQYALMRSRKGAQTANYKGDRAKRKAGWDRAGRLYPLGDCERCGEPARDRHHIDGNQLNNAPENVQRLCRRCHMEIDGRLALLPTYPARAKAAS